MQETDDGSDFVKTVEDIKAAESQAELIITDAKRKADDILKNAREGVLMERSKTEEEIVALKNAMFHAGKDEIEKEVRKIIKKAETESGKFSKQKLSAKEVSALLKQFLVDAAKR